MQSTIGIGKERDYFVENLSLLVSSGMNIADAIAGIKQDIKSKNFRAILSDVEDNVADGMPLWQALKKSDAFDAHAISLVQIGEESGKLAQNLKVIALQENKNKIFKSKIRSALLYPAFVVTVTIIVGIGIAWFILPKLAHVFDQLRVTLPLITRLLVAFGIFMGQYGYFLIPAFIVVMFLIIYILFFNYKTKHVGQDLLFMVPGVRVLVQELELSRFGYLLGTLLEAGLPLVQALDAIAQASTFVSYKKFYGTIRDSLEEGNSFEKSFSLYKKSRDFVPTPLQQMIIAGENSGKLSEALLTIGANFEAKSEVTSKNLAVILEPILLVIVWVGVVFVALSVILPIYSLIGGVNP